ncbi:MAG: molybdopterin-guanine dinucleotide biosynthesis protein MobB [Methanospirillum sp.]
MKVVQFAGWSGTGKTTLIEEVIGAAPPSLVIGVVKHLGGVHPFTLDPGRDTTRFYERGVRAVVGIDAAKGVTVLRGDTLFAALDRLSDSGCGLALVEGFKSEPFAKVVIGDLPSDRCVLRNPVAHEVIDALDRFDDYVSPGGLLRICRERAGITGAFECSATLGVAPAFAADCAALERLESRCASMPGVVAIGVHGRVYAGAGTIVLALIARDSVGGSAAFAELVAGAGGTTGSGGR